MNPTASTLAARHPVDENPTGRYGLAATWLDVTSLYPASALPPLPPAGK